MKKMLSCLMAASMLFVSGLYCPQIALASAEGTSSMAQSVKKQIMTSSGVNCVSDITVSEPVLDGIKNGQEEYRKKVEVKNDFFVKGDKKCISTNLLSFYFSYNGKDASVDENKLMILQDDDLTHHWKTSSSEEVYNAPGQSVVSQRIGIYNRETIVNDLEHNDAFHVDVICEADGEVTFNIKSLDEAQSEALKISDLMVNNEALKKKITRTMSEKTIEYVRDLQTSEDDRYRYITKEFNLAYTDKDNKLLGGTTIQACFRYNKNTREVQCLSTSHSEGADGIEVYMRSGNETRTYGGAYGEIKVKYPSRGIDKTYREVVVIKCDSNGNVTSKFIS